MDKTGERLHGGARGAARRGWFDLLDEWGASERRHAEIARWLSEEQGVAGWDAQSVTVGYERARSMWPSASGRTASP
jgi:hypothetical protein